MLEALGSYPREPASKLVLRRKSTFRAAVALPSQASIDAVMNPPPTEYLYFVARGDGSSKFSSTLIEHNRAVSRYQKGSP